jgi:hypothetical protein
MKNEIIRIRLDIGNVAETARYTRDLNDTVVAAATDALIDLDQESTDEVDPPRTLVTIITTEEAGPRVRDALRWWLRRNLEARGIVEGDSLS